MPFDPKQINESVGHPKAWQVLQASLEIKGGGGHKRVAVLQKCDIDDDTYNQITRHRNFRDYYYKIRQEAKLKKELSQELSKQFADQLATQIVEQQIDLRKTFEKYAPEALDKLVSVMRNAPYYRDQASAATEILDRAGYVKIQKQLTIHADAEAIIRELNKQVGARDASAIDITPAQE